MRLLFAHFLLVATSSLAQNVSLPERTRHDISYGPHERHKLDLWRANSGEPTPLVIFIHGGGWAGGDKADVPPELVKVMLARGVSVASINYRYSRIATLPAPVHDAARAVQFLRTQAAEWKLNPERFGAYGISAGGCTHSGSPAMMIWPIPAGRIPLSEPPAACRPPSACRHRPIWSQRS